MKSFALAVLATGILFARVFDDRFKAIDGRVGLGLNDLAESLVGFLYPLLILGLSVLGEGFLGYFGIGLQHMDRLHISLEKTPRDIAPPGEQTLGRY